MGRRLTVRLATVVLGTLALAACQGAGGQPSADPTAVESTSSTAPSSTAPSPSSTVTVADPDHAVPPPGPRTGPLASVDLLVVGQDTLPDDAVSRVEHTKGVTRVVRISLATPSVEDRLLKVVAVDPGTYRNFTPVQSADSQMLWDRVAGGEVAVDSNLRRTLAPDSAGYVKLGADADAPKIHLGAWAPQIPGVADAVVNEKWGKALGMKHATPCSSPPPRPPPTASSGRSGTSSARVCRCSGSTPSRSTAWTRRPSRCPSSTAPSRRRSATTPTRSPVAAR
jgi:hypothetical protein